MSFLGDILKNNMSININKDIEDVERDGFMVLCYDGKMTIKSNIHPWRNNHKGREMQGKALLALQKEIGGEYVKTVFDPELVFDISGITSARCISNPAIFAFNDWVEITTVIDDGVVIVPSEMIEVFEKEFPSISFKGEEAEWKFIEYDGEYPALCSGDTILHHGTSVIRTKIINHECMRWKVEIPSVLENVTIPKEIWSWDNRESYHCGGCD